MKLVPPPITNHWPNEGWTEHGGYDCMTAGIRVGPVVLDGADYGQGQCQNMTTKQRHHMEADAKFIAAAPVMAKALAELCVDAEYALRKFLPPGSYSMSHSLRNALDALKAAGYTVEAADQS
jgi:hypothetical protein